MSLTYDGCDSHAEPLEEKTAQKTASSFKPKCPLGKSSCFLQRSSRAPPSRPPVALWRPLDELRLQGAKQEVGTGLSLQAEEWVGPSSNSLPWALWPGRHTHGGLGLRGKQSHFLMIGHWDSKKCECLAGVTGYNSKREKEKMPGIRILPYYQTRYMIQGLKLWNWQHQASKFRGRQESGCQNQTSASSDQPDLVLPAASRHPPSHCDSSEHP